MITPPETSAVAVAVTAAAGAAIVTFGLEVLYEPSLTFVIELTVNCLALPTAVGAVPAASTVPPENVKIGGVV